VPVLPGLETAPPVPAAAAIGNLARPAARVVAAPTSAPQAFAAALAQPTVSQPASAASIGAPAAPQAPAPLNQQLAPPLLGLRTAGEGTHVLTLTVSPDAVGPVTVRAHVTGDTMRIELSAPTGQGTDALKAMLPDLKRDLAQGGLGSALTIASPGSDSSAAGSQNPFGGAGGAFDQNDRPNYFRSTGSSTVPVSAGSSTATTVGATSALDVLV
jgi:flagellar hook-length control protein FliK